MKNTFITFLQIFFTTCVFAQAPLLINYQAIIRNSSGNILSNQIVVIKISILDLSPSGAVVYSEQHNDTTNQFGLIILKVGAGTVLTGTVTNINWGVGDKYMAVEVDIGSGVVNMGSFQLLSVPYSLYANDINEAIKKQIRRTKTMQILEN